MEEMRSVPVYSNNQEEKGSLELLHRFPGFLDRWNTNEEAAKYLVSARHHPEWLSKEPHNRPVSGHMFIFDKREVKFKRDGYAWKRRKDGRTPREDHMRLKVFGVELLYGCYAHSDESPSFHRRCYWLLQMPEIVLVHYLDVPTEDKGLPNFSDAELYQLVLSKPCVLDKLRMQLSAPAPFVSSESRGASTENLASPLYFEFPLSGMGNLPSRDSSGSRSCSVPTSPLCVPRHCSTPFGSIATGDMSRRTGSWPYLATPSPHSTATVQNSLPMIHQPLASPPSIEITEFIPEWAYEDGETKMVVTGNMPSGPAYGYSMKFGDTVVHAYEVQAGVLRCFCPANPQGLVSWQLYCNGVAVASSKVFEYKQRPGESVAVMSSTSSSSLFSAAGGASGFPVLQPNVPVACDSGKMEDCLSGPPADSMFDTGPLNPFTSGSAESWQWAIESSPNVSESSLPPSNASSSWVLPRSPTQDWCDSSIQTTLSSRSSGSSMSSLFDDPNAPSVAQWCAVLGDQRNVIQEDFERLNLSDGEQKQLLHAASAIQAAFRKYRQKAKDQEKQNSAALLIQNWYRRYRRDCHSRKSESVQIEAETMAAMKIQRFLRRSMLRKNRAFTPLVRANGSKLHQYRTALGDSIMPGSLPLSLAKVTCSGGI